MWNQWMKTTLAEQDHGYNLTVCLNKANHPFHNYGLWWFIMENPHLYMFDMFESMSWLEFPTLAIRRNKGWSVPAAYDSTFALRHDLTWPRLHLGWPMGCTIGGFHGHGDTPIAGWFISGKIPSFEMDDDIQGSPMTQETANWWSGGFKIVYVFTSRMGTDDPHGLHWSEKIRVTGSHQAS